MRCVAQLFSLAFEVHQVSFLRALQRDGLRMVSSFPGKALPTRKLLRKRRSDHSADIEICSVAIQAVCRPNSPQMCG